MYGLMFLKKKIVAACVVLFIVCMPVKILQLPLGLKN